MPGRRFGKVWRGLLLLTVLLAQPAVARTQEVPATPTVTGADALLAQWRAEAMAGSPLFGPDTGTLPHIEDTIGGRWANLWIRDFYARARFQNPYDAAEHVWDYGFLFRSNRSDEYRVYVSSRGEWKLALGTLLTLQSGPVEGLNLAAGAENTIELVVNGGQALMSVNGGLAIAIDVSRSTVRGDLEIGTGFVTDQMQPGATTGYADFAVWQLAGTPSSPSPEAEALIDQGRALRDTSAPLSGPNAGALVFGPEDSRWIAAAGAGVDIRDGYARATIRVPQEGNDHAWDAGLSFRDTGANNQWRLVITSDGSWHIAFGLDTLLLAGELPDFEVQPGDPIEIETSFFGDRAAFAVNGTPVSAFDISTGTKTGNVRVASPFFGVDTIPFGVIAYEDFAVWSEERDGGVSVPPANEVSEQTAQDARTFAGLLRTASVQPDHFGPQQGQITLLNDGIGFSGGMMETHDFAAQAQFFNPFDANEHPWDYGFAFRMRSDGDPPEVSYYVLLVSSDLRWYLAESSADGNGSIIQQGTTPGFDLSPFGDNVITLAVVGDDAYFAINGAFVEKLDVSSLKQAGRTLVIAGLLQGSYVAGGWTAYDYFEVWSLDSVDTSSSRINTDPLGGAYTSPTYGYSLLWDGSWSVAAESSDDATDTLELTNGTSTVTVTGYPTGITPLSCLDEQADLLRQRPDVTNVEPWLNNDGSPMRAGDATSATALYSVTVAAEGQPETLYDAFVRCQPISLGESMISMVHFAPDATFDDEVDARNTLFASLTFSAVSEGSATPEPATAEAETPVAGTPEPAGSLVVRLSEQADSGVSGLATLTGSGAQTSISIVALGAVAGTHAAIYAGRCDDIADTTAIPLNDIDETGRSESIVDAELSTLESDGYVLVLSDVVARTPVACGDLGTGE
jgi:hypothetical protein